MPIQGKTQGQRSPMTHPMEAARNLRVCKSSMLKTILTMSHWSLKKRTKRKSRALTLRARIQRAPSSSSNLTSRVRNLHSSLLLKFRKKMKMTLTLREWTCLL